MDYWIWLSQLRGVGPILQKKLLAAFEGDPEKIYRASVADLVEVDGIGKATAKKITEFRLDEVKATIELVEKLNIEVLTLGASSYADVFSCKRSPILFYYRGTLPKIRGVAVVGARRCTEDAKRAASEIGSAVGERGHPVISGMAKGVDSYAHTTCLKVGGYTMAVLASGVDICYPKEHRTLYEKIMNDGGVVISAYPPGVRPHPKFFLERNAHIVAWSTDVVVVQASVNSGSLTTARFANEQGRNLYVVPHSIYTPEAEGSNLLLMKGARPYLGPSSLSFADGRVETEGDRHASCSPTGDPRNRRNSDTPLSSLEQKIITYLHNNGSCTVDKLANHLEIPELDLTNALIQLEMHNHLKIKGRTLNSVRHRPWTF